MTTLSTARPIAGRSTLDKRSIRLLAFAFCVAFWGSLALIWRMI